MDREDLLAFLAAYENCTLWVCPDGTITDTDDDRTCTPDELETALAEFTEQFKRVIQWAKSAPDYTSRPQTTTDENGRLVDATTGIPL